MQEARKERIGMAMGVVVLLALTACASDVAARAVATPVPTPWAAPVYDRESAPGIPEDPYETLPKLRYKLAPSAPIVSAKAGAPGSGKITVSWVETWLGRGEFEGFAISIVSVLGDLTVGKDVRSASFSPMKAGKYRFTVTALGQYGDISATSAPVSLLPKPPVVAAAGCGYLIDVNLTSQSMVASRCGVVFITSPITSGRPGYRSPTGTFYTSTKYQHVWFEYHGLYTPRYVKYAIRFWGLYYLHTWSQPALSDFGPGSQNGQYASLGCIEMPDNVMAAIYNWEPTGTAVRIHY